MIPRDRVAERRNEDGDDGRYSRRWQDQTVHHWLSLKSRGWTLWVQRGKRSRPGTSPPPADGN